MSSTTPSSSKNRDSSAFSPLMFELMRKEPRGPRAGADPVGEGLLFRRVKKEVELEFEGGFDGRAGRPRSR